MRKIKTYEGFKEWLLYKPKIFKGGEKLKYIDENGNIRYCKYVRDELGKGDMSAFSFIGGKAMSIVDDEKEGRKHIEKSKLMQLTEEEKDAEKYNL